MLAGPVVPGMSLGVSLPAPRKVRDIMLSSSTFNLRECRRIEERQKALARGIALETKQTRAQERRSVSLSPIRYDPLRDERTSHTFKMDMPVLSGPPVTLAFAESKDVLLYRSE